ncbi:hypothetical protein RMATCC62417_06936 [Rhizopus microsporus]|nr:hypothetical protein RMATCC62417_06936 [Rhizopus microsporus]
MNTFIYEDGKGKVFDEQGQEAHIYEMKVDDAQYSLEQLTNYYHYMDLKPPEKPMKIIEETEEESTAHGYIVERTTLRSNRKYTNSDKERFFFSMYEQGLSLRKAAAQLSIPHSTAQSWKKKYEMGEDVFKRKEGSGRPQDRPAILNEEHQKYLLDLVDDNPSLVLDQMMESLTSQFEGLEISKTSLYNFVKKECKISVKRAYFYSVDRNSLEKLRERQE